MRRVVDPENNVDKHANHLRFGRCPINLSLRVVSHALLCLFAIPSPWQLFILALGVLRYVTNPSTASAEPLPQNGSQQICLILITTNTMHDSSAAASKALSSAWAPLSV